jgi:nicotinamide mononucleotide transporter
MTWIEAIAVVFGLVCVLLTIRQSIWCWPTGLVQVALYIFIFYRVRLYSKLVLHVIYVLLLVCGWYHWLHGGRDQGKLEVSRIPLGALVIWIAIVFASTGVWGVGAWQVSLTPPCPTGMPSSLLRASSHNG